MASEDEITSDEAGTEASEGQSPSNIEDDMRFESHASRSVISNVMNVAASAVDRVTTRRPAFAAT